MAVLVAITGLLPAGQAGASVSDGDTGAIAGVDGAVSIQVSPGPWYMKFRHSGKCINNPNYSTANVALDQWTCVPQSNELWWFDYVFTDIDGWDYYRIRNAYSGKCLNVSGGSSNDGVAIIQYPCGNYVNEYFVYWTDGTLPAGYGWVQSYSTGKVLNIRGGSTANGADLIQYRRCYCSNEYIDLF